MNILLLLFAFYLGIPISLFSLSTSVTSAWRLEGKKTQQDPPGDSQADNSTTIDTATGSDSNSLIANFNALLQQERDQDREKREEEDRQREEEKQIEEARRRDNEARRDRETKNLIELLTASEAPSTILVTKLVESQRNKIVLPK